MRLSQHVSPLRPPASLLPPPQPVLSHLPFYIVLPSWKLVILTSLFNRRRPYRDATDMVETSHTTRPDAKRRKIRKGTHSCWACKRRKMKCVFDSRNDLVCQGCRHKNSACVSQEFPEHGSRLQEVRQVSSDGAPLSNRNDRRSDAGLPTPASYGSVTPLAGNSNIEVRSLIPQDLAI